MVGSVSDPVITELITTVNDSAFWAGANAEQEDIAVEEPVTETTHHEQTAGAQPDKVADQDHMSVSCSGRASFQFAGLTKPPSLTMRAA